MLLLNKKVRAVIFALISIAALFGRMVSGADVLPVEVLMQESADLRSKALNFEALGSDYLTTEPEKAKHYAREGFRIASETHDEVLKARLARLLVPIECYPNTNILPDRLSSRHFYYIPAMT